MVGHAEYDEKGKDIVCSAASILFYTFIESCNTYENKSCEVSIEDDICTARFVGKDDVGVNATIFVTGNGFKLLADGYPDNVKLEIV